MLVALERRTNFSKEKNSFHCHAKIPYIREKASLNENPLRHTMMTEGFSLIARHQRGVYQQGVTRGKLCGKVSQRCLSPNFVPKGGFLRNSWLLARTLDVIGVTSFSV